jgi:hypothetical protein
MNKIFISLVVFFLLLIPSTIAHADEYVYSAESQLLLKQLEDEIVGTILAVINHEKAAGKNLADFKYSLSIPAKAYVELGMLIDTKDIKSGFKVVSLTKGSAADQAGIKINDVILEINGAKVAEIINVEAVRGLWHIEPYDELKLGIRTSSGLYKSIIVTVPGTYLPEITLKLGPIKEPILKKSVGDSCGIVTVHLIPPRELGLSTVKFRKIDELNVLPKKRSRRVSPGKHQIYFSKGSVFGDAVLGAAKRLIEIDVKANTKYYIAAKAIKDDQSIYGEKPSSWEPVIWKTKTVECD